MNMHYNEVTTKQSPHEVYRQIIIEEHRLKLSKNINRTILVYGSEE